MPDTELIGPWQGGDFQGVAEGNVGLGVDADLDLLDRFVRGVARLVRRRRAAPGADADPALPSVFLLGPVVPEHPALAGPRREPLLNNGRCAVSGLLWFVNAPVVSGSCVPLELGDDDHLFRFVVDDLTLGDTPAVLYDPREGVEEIRFYPHGLVQIDNCVVTPVAGVEVTLEAIFSSLERTYRRFLRTPDGQERAAKLWTNNRPPRPSDAAEERIQMYLVVGLNEAFLTCDIRTEEPSPEGRLDVIVEEVEPSNGRVTRHAVLELKAIRGMRSSGAAVSPAFNREHVDSGVDQAAGYRIEKHATASALCCFDMRPEDSPDLFEHARGKAAGLGVALQSWYLFPTSRAARRARATALLAQEN